MSVIKIGSNDYKECLKKRVALEAKILAEDNYMIEIKQMKQGDTLFFICSIVNDELTIKILQEFVANILSDLIINHLEFDFIYRMVNFNCQKLNEKEKNKIVDSALSRLNILSSKTDEKIKAKFKRKNKVLAEIMNYITTSQEIVLEGFVRFRLKDYVNDLEVAVKDAIEEYGIKKEYRKFVHLLKHYVDGENNNKIVNVIKINNEFKLLDQAKKIIENPFLDKSILEQLQQKLEHEDLIINVLISLAPQEIILHFKEPLDLVESLKNIFPTEVSICLGCDYCKIKSLNELKEKMATQS